MVLHPETGSDSPIGSDQDRGRDKYINGDYPQPLETDLSFRRWRTENAMVKGWLINSMDHSLVMNFIRYPTTK